MQIMLNIYHPYSSLFIIIIIIKNDDHNVRCTKQLSQVPVKDPGHMTAWLSVF